MIRLSSFWCMIEHVLLNEGFGRRRRLRFFIHPVFLFPLQLFILLQLLICRISNLLGVILVSLIFIFQIFHSGIMSVFLCCRTFIFYFSEVDEISPLTSEANTSEIFAKSDVFEAIVSTDHECKASLQVFSLMLYSAKEGEDKDDEEFILCEEPPDYVSQSCLLEDYALADEDDQESSSCISVVYEVLEPPSEVISNNSSNSSHHIPRSTLEDQRHEITSSLPSTSALSTAMQLQQGRESRVETALEDYALADEDDQESSSCISVVYEVLEPPSEVISNNSSNSSHHNPRSTLENQQYEMTSSLPSTSALSTAMQLQQGRESRVETDLFFEDYNARMRWFDQINAERRHVVSVISNVKLGTASLNDRIEPLSFSFPRSAHEKLAKSIRSDFEVVYVGQACLSWEALCHQHRKVKEIALKKDARFQGKVAEKFQQFQVLVERFTENEKCQGKRFLNYAHTRFCNTSLLHVPDVPGYVEEVREDVKGESTKASMVLEAIEKAMGAFWLFLRCDINKNTWGMLQKLKMRDCQVEDPRDLELFTSLSKEAQKKNMKMKELLKKSRRMRRTPGEEIQVENLTCMVDINLVIRVLKMTVVTSAQIQWCHDKLNSILLDQRAFRATNGCLLFPHS